MIVANPQLEEALIAERRRMGVDGKDEVWDGEYVVMPDPNYEHQSLVKRLLRLLCELVEDTGLGEVVLGTNVTDRPDGWRKNFRIPDLSVRLPGNRAENRDTHWLGGLDLVIEIVSPGDRSEQKLGFYASVGTREVLLVERDAWRLRLFRAADGAMGPAGEVSIDDDPIRTETVDLSWSLRAEAGLDRPRIVVDSGDCERLC